MKMNNIFGLDNKVAVITGILGNLGPVWAEALLQSGALVMGIDLPDRDKKNVMHLEREYSDRFFIFGADILNKQSLEDIEKKIVECYGVPSVIVNNAGIDQPPQVQGKPYLFEEIPLEICRKIFDVNTMGALQVIQVFGKDMVKERRGSIINIGSLYATVSPDVHFYDHIKSDPPFLKPPAYGASKAALVNLTKYLATFWGRFGVRVNALSPGGVLGNQDQEFKRKFCNRVPMGRMAEFKDLVGPLIFLASDASSFVTGIELRVDGGFTAW